MSGRSGYRKTDRRQSPARPLLERLDKLNERCIKRFPARRFPDVRLGFMLPKGWRPFVASGPHGPGINVFRGFVQIAHGSSDECMQTAMDFCATIGRGKPSEIIEATLRSSAHPDRSYGRWLSVVNGALVESGGIVRPRIYERAA